MPTMDAMRARKLIAQGLLHCGRRPFSLSWVFSIPLFCTSPVEVKTSPSGEGGGVRSGSGGRSTAPLPLRDSGGRQLTLLERRLIEKEGRRRSALRRRSSLFGGCAVDVDSLAPKREALT
jgi:hypothetical protein